MWYHPGLKPRLDPKVQWKITAGAYSVMQGMVEWLPNHYVMTTSVTKQKPLWKCTVWVIETYWCGLNGVFREDQGALPNESGSLWSRHFLHAVHDRPHVLAEWPSKLKPLLRPLHTGTDRSVACIACNILLLMFHFFRYNPTHRKSTSSVATIIMVFCRHPHWNTVYESLLMYFSSNVCFVGKWQKSVCNFTLPPMCWALMLLRHNL